MKIIILKSLYGDDYDYDEKTLAAMYDLAVDVTPDQYFKLNDIILKFNSNVYKLKKNVRYYMLEVVDIKDEHNSLFKDYNELMTVLDKENKTYEEKCQKEQEERKKKSEARKRKQLEKLKKEFGE